MKNMKHGRFEPVFSPDAVTSEEALVRDLKLHGSIYPIVLCEGVVVDGLKRLSVLSGNTEYPLRTMNVDGDPFFWRWVLNRSRPWNLLETALVYEHLPNDQRVSFVQDRGLGKSPFLAKALNFVATTIDHRSALRDGQLSLAVLRDLACAGGEMAEWVELFLSCPGTVGEKRTAAKLAKTCFQRGVVVRLSGCSTMADIVRMLDRTARPVQHSLRDRFKETVDEMALPNNARLSIDDSLEMEGVKLNIELNRQNLETLEKVSEQLTELFDRLDFI